MAIRTMPHTATPMLTDTKLLRLLQLSSVSLPVGGFAFSQGLESSIELGWIRSKADTFDALSVQLTESLGRLDLPLLQRAMSSANKSDLIALNHWNDLALACRETQELRLTDTAMGKALARLLRSLDIEVPFAPTDPLSFVVAYAVAASYWQIPFQSAALGFSWAWLENQVAAATKLVPLGQTDAQRLFGELQPLIPEALEQASTLDDDDIGACLPALAIASCYHETQYSRLFRS
jgi:urease accessory protein